MTFRAGDRVRLLRAATLWPFAFAKPWTYPAGRVFVVRRVHAGGALTLEVGNGYTAVFRDVARLEILTD